MLRGFPNATAVYGLDLSPYFVAVGAFRAANSKGEFDHLKYFHANAEKTMFPDGEFDLIVCNFLFHEVPQDATRVILNELKRIFGTWWDIGDCGFDPNVLKSDKVLSQFRKWAFEVTEPHIYGYYNSDMSRNLYDHGFQNVVKKRMIQLMRSGYVKNLILFIVKSLGTNQPLRKVVPVGVDGEYPRG